MFYSLPPFSIEIKKEADDESKGLFRRSYVCSVDNWNLELKHMGGRWFAGLPCAAWLFARGKCVCVCIHVCGLTGKLDCAQNCVSAYCNSLQSVVPADAAALGLIPGQLQTDLRPHLLTTMTDVSGDVLRLHRFQCRGLNLRHFGSIQPPNLHEDGFPSFSG